MLPNDSIKCHLNVREYTKTKPKFKNGDDDSYDINKMQSKFAFFIEGHGK